MLKKCEADVLFTIVVRKSSLSNVDRYLHVQIAVLCVLRFVNDCTHLNSRCECHCLTIQLSKSNSDHRDRGEKFSALLSSINTE